MLVKDEIQRFLFDNADVRGEIVQLGESYQQILAHHKYPAGVARLLGEFQAAAALLCEILKFDGTLTLQARSNGEVPLVMAEATSRHELRAIARRADQAQSEDFQALLGDGQLSITIEPHQGERYQGIVALDGSNLAECIEQYFLQSEQLATRLWLFCDGIRAGGLMLQQLPRSSSSRAAKYRQDWQHLVHLSTTITAAELLSLDRTTILHRLYHQESLQSFDAAPVIFRCSCSRERTLSALRALGQNEAQEIINVEGSIDINCEFCHQHYHFSQDDIDKAFSTTLH